MANVKEEKILSTILNTQKEQLLEFLEDCHPADLLDAIRRFDGDKREILNKIPPEIMALIIDQADNEEKYELLALFPDFVQGDILNQMSSDELVDLLGSIPPEKARQLLGKMGREDLAEVRELLGYGPTTAGGIMATEFVYVKDTMTVDETLKYLRKAAPDAETAYYIYVLDEEGILKGVVSLRELVISDPQVQIAQIMNENVISIPVQMNQEEVGHIFEKYGFLTMPVVDEKGKLLGIVTVDDIMEVLREETTEDFYRLAGVKEGERVTGSVFSSVQKRLPWLFVNLLTAILAAATVSLFEGTIQKAVALAAFMPIVAGMGGNTGSQTLTIIVRGIALGELNVENAKKVFLKEVSVGLIMGSIIGLVVSLLGFLWEKNPIFGLVLGLAMLLNMALATLAGFAVPVVLKKLKIDPALASPVFVTTVTDVLGFFFFLGLATLFLAYLVR